MTTLPDLIQRLAEATGPDRELDGLIYVHIYGSNRCMVTDGYASPGSKPRLFVADDVFEFTSSIDAAISLVPEGWYGRVEPRFYSEYDKFEKRMVLWNAYCIRPRWEDASPVSDDYFDVVGNADPHIHPAIALCIAALRSRLPTQQD